jgi:hypothetical protein
MADKNERLSTARYAERLRKTNAEAAGDEEQEAGTPGAEPKGELVGIGGTGGTSGTGGVRAVPDEVGDILGIEDTENRESRTKNRRPRTKK